ncbi:MAG: tetratricopeptide repeat protein [Candidatus Sericytochromatia bacterium]
MDPAALLAQARALTRQGAWAAAQGAYAQLLQHAPEALPVHLEYAQLLHHCGQESAAITAYQDLLALQPQHADALFQLGVLYREQEDLPAAQRCFECLEAAHPESYLAALGLAQTALVAEQPACSRHWFDQMQRRRRAAPDWDQQQWRELAGYPDLPLRLSKKWQHDLAYLDWLLTQSEGVNGERLRQQREQLAQATQRWQAELQRGAFSLASSREMESLLGAVAHRWEPGEPTRLLGDWDGQAAQARFLARPPHYTVIDNALSPELLQALYQFSLRANVWQNYLHGQNYLCAYPQDGINLDLIYRLTAELRARLPGVLGPHRLKKFWMYKYASSQHQGVQLHADSGAVNLNLWLTPDQGNSSPESGGLLLYDVPVPLFATDAEFNAFNRNVPAMQQMLRQHQARTITVPYRQNRLTIFDANLLHETMPYRFASDYPSQRVNLTLMFGRRGRASGAGANLPNRHLPPAPGR